MERDDFVASLVKEGYKEIVTVEREPLESVGVHSHPFESKALILEGEIRIRTGEAEQVCGIGQTFHLRANEPHAESYGPQGVRYVVGRKEVSGMR